MDVAGAWCDHRTLGHGPGAGAGAAAARQVVDSVLLGGDAGRHRESGAGDRGNPHAAASGPDFARCDRADTVPATGVAPNDAGVAIGAARGTQHERCRPDHAPRHARQHAAGERHSRWRVRTGDCTPAGTRRFVTRAGADRLHRWTAWCVLAECATHHGGAEPSVAAAARRSQPPGACACPALRDAALAILRQVRHAGHALAGAGQLPGRSRARDRDAHVAHEHRAAAALDHQRTRPRADHRRGHDRATGTHVRDAGHHAPVSRTFLQLVRPDRPARAGSGVHQHRGQRQPGRPPRGATSGVPRDCCR